MPKNEEQLQNDLRQMINDRSFSMEYAMRYIGTYYSWGGDDPVGGFDCSGLASEIGKAVGFLKRKERLTAEGFRQRFFSGDPSYKIDQPFTGAFILYVDKTQNKATHIEMCIDGKRSIGANGGGSTTITKADAIVNNAFVQIRPINYNDGRELVFIDPIMSLYPELHEKISSSLIIPEKKIIIGG